MVIPNEQDHRETSQSFTTLMQDRMVAMLLFNQPQRLDLVESVLKAR